MAESKKKKSIENIEKLLKDFEDIKQTDNVQTNKVLEDIEKTKKKLRQIKT